MRFRHAVRATRGARPYQEDAAVVWTPQDAGTDPSDSLLAVLADGMGGHAGGALASETACETVVKTFAAAASAGSNRDRLAAALDAANAAIAAIVRARPELDGMGSTLVVAALADGGLEWISVGDSPMFLLRRGEIELLNEDHSLAPALDQLAAEGKISVHEARNNPRRHMLRSAVTGDEMELIDQSRRPLALAPGDWIVLASDGIHTLEPDEIARVVIGYAADGPAEVASALIRDVVARRETYQDNATVLVVEVLAA